MTNENTIVVNGYTVPQGCIPVWVIDEDKKNELISNRSGINYSPSNYARIVQYMSPEHVVINLGHNDLANRQGDDRFHKKVPVVGLNYFDNHLGGKPVYLTFDQAAVFRLQHIHPTPNGALEWHFKLINSPRTMVTGQVFMIMPFSVPYLTEFYTQHIKDFLEKELQIRVIRADDTRDNDIISDTILTRISESEFIIADATIANKNVFYEIGYAVAIGKEIILLQEEKEVKEPIFFDRIHRRAIYYKTSDVDSFRHQLLETVKNIRTRISEVV